MADDIKELTFSNSFYDANGNVEGSYSGDLFVDFTTDTVLKGSTLNGNANIPNISISYSAQNNQYTINDDERIGQIN